MVQKVSSSNSFVFCFGSVYSFYAIGGVVFFYPPDGVLSSIQVPNTVEENKEEEKLRGFKFEM